MTVLRTKESAKYVSSRLMSGIFDERYDGEHVEECDEQGEAVVGRYEGLGCQPR